MRAAGKLLKGAKKLGSGGKKGGKDGEKKVKKVSAKQRFEAKHNIEMEAKDVIIAARDVTIAERGDMLEDLGKALQLARANVTAAGVALEAANARIGQMDRGEGELGTWAKVQEDGPGRAVEGWRAARGVVYVCVCVCVAFCVPEAACGGCMLRDTKHPVPFPSPSLHHPHNPPHNA